MPEGCETTGAQTSPFGGRADTKHPDWPHAAGNLLPG